TNNNAYIHNPLSCGKLIRLFIFVLLSSILTLFFYLAPIIIIYIPFPSLILKKSTTFPYSCLFITNTSCSFIPLYVRFSINADKFTSTYTLISGYSSSTASCQFLLFGFTPKSSKKLSIVLNSTTVTLFSIPIIFTPSFLYMLSILSSYTLFYVFLIFFNFIPLKIECRYHPLLIYHFI